MCPKGAISIKRNSEGFIEPLIDKEKCINCGICLKKCPQVDEALKRNKPIKCYAAKNKENEKLKNGSSGSIFSVIADYVLNNRGVVYGVAFNDNLNLNTIRITNKKDLIDLMGSKYIQSNTRDTFSLVKKDLKKDLLVLYVGTPCQIAGLKNFLGEEYEKLITIDLVCHGVPSEKLFKKYIESIEKKYKSKVKNYYFRNKEKNGWGLNTKIILENGKKLYVSANLDPYYKSFLEGKTYREACYNCKYANTSRVGDITLADFWGIRKEHPDFNTNLGVSAILVNTKKGIEIFNKLESKIEFIETSIDKISNENKNLIRPTKRPNIRTNVYENLDNINFEKYAKEKLKFKRELKDIIKNAVPHRIKKIIKHTILGGK